MFCNMTKEHQKKAGRNWKTTRTEKMFIDQATYNRIIDAIPWFKNLGGTEEVTRNRNNVITRLVSTSPSGDLRSIYTFKF